MRHPTIHGFLKWAGPTLVIFIGACIGLIATVAQGFPEARPWAERLFYQWWPVVTATWFLVASGVVICAYIWVIIWTGRPPKAKPVKAQPGVLLMGHGLDHVRIETDPDVRRSYEARFFPTASRAAGIGSRAVAGPSGTTIWDGLEERTRGSFLRYLFAAKHRKTLDQAMDRASETLGTMGPPSPPETWISLDEAIRYLGKRSQWGAEQNSDDPGFSVRVGVEMRDALACGDLTARGRWFHLLKGGIQDPPLHTLKPIPQEYWQTVQIDAYRAMYREGHRIGSRLVENVLRDGDHEGIHDVQVSKRQVEARWPRADESIFSEAWDESAKDRISYVRIRDLAPEYGIELAHPDPGASSVADGLEGELRQAAVDGRLKVWGRKQRTVPSNEPLVPIPGSHFEEFEFGHGCLHYEAENKHSHTGKLGKRVGDFPDEAYFDLYLSFEDTRAVLRGFAEKQS